MTRRGLLETLAAEIAARHGGGVLRVAIDGVDGAGKTTLADELSGAVEARRLASIRASIDSFHNPRAIRYARGRHSPAGYYHDSFDLARLEAQLLRPLAPGGSGRYRTGVFDHRADAPVASPERTARPPAVLLFDGIFLHRPELARHWDLSVFLEVSPRCSMRRCFEREPGHGSPDPADPSNRRYLEGQRIYLDACRPAARATFAVDNEDFTRPRITRRDGRALPGRS